MANRIQRKAREEAQLAYESCLRQKLKFHKKQNRKPVFNYLLRQALLRAEFKFELVPMRYITPEIKVICSQGRNFMRRANLKNYYPVYGSQQALLIDILRNKYAAQIFLNYYNDLSEWMFKASIVRSIRSWKPKHKNNPTKLFWSFVQHCYIRYPHQIPFCLPQLYERSRSNPRRNKVSYWAVGVDLLFHLAAGNGWHTFEKFSQLNLPRKTNYYVLSAPKDYRHSYNHSLYWACLRAYGMKPKSIDLFWSTFMERAPYFIKYGKEYLTFIGAQKQLDFKDWIKLFYQGNEIFEFLERQFPDGFDPYYNSVIRFFTKSFTAIGMNEITPWLRYIENQKVSGHPLKMKGRSVTNFRRLFEAHLKEEYVAQNNGIWDGIDLPDFYLNGGEDKMRIIQLKTDFDLYVEGKMMSHCVYSYVDECLAGDSSIWSLQEQVEQNNWKPLVTIELTSNKEIVQAYCRFNKSPKKEHHVIINKWVEAANLIQCS